MSGCVGVMQGRLSPPIGGRIQAFPWDNWRAEFSVARQLGFALMEWTLDQDRLHENPLVADPVGTRKFAAEHGVTVSSVTGDCFMQAPFYKTDGAKRAALLDDFRVIIDAAAEVGARYVVLPLVDEGSLENRLQTENLRDGLLSFTDKLEARSVRIAFESDHAPASLADFVDGYPEPAFGVNYDIGNSASLGYDPDVEMAAYGGRIVNVHVKDRTLGGTTVALGEGNADFPRVFGALRRAGYNGDFVLQTARAKNGDHAGVAAKYRDMTLAWWSQAAEH